MIVALAVGADSPKSPSVPDAARVYVDAAAEGQYQNGSQKYPFATIQAGIDAAQDLGAVEVALGNYDTFVMGHPVRLKGAGIDSTRIYLADAPCRIENADGASVWGITASRNVAIASCKFPYFVKDVHLDDATAVVSGNILEFSDEAVSLARSSSAWVYGNVAVYDGLDIACDDSDCRYEESGNAFRPDGLLAGETCTRGIQ